MNGQQPMILALDQGTTSSRAIVFDNRATVIAQAQQEFPQLYPGDGMVEHRPEDLWEVTYRVARMAVREAIDRGGRIAALGLTNQRETTLIWDRDTGEAIHNAIVWQDRRTAGLCRDMKAAGQEPEIIKRTGLLLDPYFSASKIKWILDNVDGARERAKKGKLAFGTVDSYLIWKLTGGKVHATDATNASRTSLFNIHSQQWDEELLLMFAIPKSLLPEVRDCAADYGVTARGLFDEAIPISGVAGDQQAAAFGQCCFAPGDIKSTYGTGCFMLLNTGADAVTSQNRLLTTVGYRLKGQVSYALEGSIFVAGAAVQWLRDQMKFIKSAPDSEGVARSLGDNAGVYLVPAFTGLGAPHWQPEVRGALFGMTRATGQAEIVRAALESVCYQTADLLAAMQQDGVAPGRLKVDGGMVANDWVLQYLSDILGLEVSRPRVMETTALGAAFLAGIKAGIFGGPEEIGKVWQQEQQFSPAMAELERVRLLSGWQRAVTAAKVFSE